MLHSYLTSRLEFTRQLVSICICRILSLHVRGITFESQMSLSADVLEIC